MRARKSRARSTPGAISISSRPSGAVPRNNTRLAFWLMLMKPPAPARRQPNSYTLMLPSASAVDSQVKPNVA